MTLRDKRVLQLRILAGLAESCTFPGEEVEGTVEGLTANSIAARYMLNLGEVVDELMELMDSGPVRFVNAYTGIAAWRPNWTPEGNIKSTNDTMLP